MGDMAEFQLENYGFYESREYCYKHNEWWPESDQWGCRQCLEEEEHENE
jgi:hypothetical protein